MLSTTTFLTDNMRATALNGFTNATDVADYLVGKGVAFRDAHEMSGKLVLLCEGSGKSLLDLSLEEFQSVSPVIEAGIYDEITLGACVEKRDNIGAPARKRELESIAHARNRLAQISIIC
jgi:argininosuccinate lyase